MECSIGDKNREYFGVDFRLTTRCNYSCEYCVDLRNNKVRDIPFNLERFMTFLYTVYDIKKKPMWIYVFGGEPTIFNRKNQTHWFSNILDMSMVNAQIHPKGKVELQTNLSLSIPELTELVDCADPAHLHFAVSAHPTQTDFDSLLRKCQFLYDEGFLWSIKVMHLNRISEKCLKWYYDFLEIFGPSIVEISPLHCAKLDDVNPYEEIDVLYEVSKKNDFSTGPNDSFVSDIPLTVGRKIETVSQMELYRNHQNSFIGSRCWIPDNKCIINFDGTVFSCPYQIFDEIELNKSRLNIYTDEHLEASIWNHFETESMICPYNFCYFDNIYNYKDLTVKEDPGVERILKNHDVEIWKRTL